MSVNLQTDVRPGQQRNTALDQQMKQIENAVNSLFAGQPPARRLVVSNTIALSSDEYLFVDASGGDVIISLPAATVLQQLRVAKTDASTNTVTVIPFGTDTINGMAATVLAAQYDTVWLMADGGKNWIKFGGGGTTPPTTTASLDFSINTNSMYVPMVF